MVGGTEPRALEAWFDTDRVGRLEPAEGGGLLFRYAPEWLAHPDARPLSASLPLSPSAVVRGAADVYFRELLPAKPVRSQICRKLGLPDDDFALLEALGGDCAGAVSLHREGVDPRTLRQGRAPLALSELEGATTDDQVPLLIGRTRATLAGSQPKLPVLLDGEALALPVGPAPTSHILKLGAPDLAHLAANEGFTTLFAQELGLATARIHLQQTESEPILVSERFDRAHDGALRRLHQEDFVQAAGPRPPDEPFELADAVALVRKHGRNPLGDTHRLLVWMVFHLISGDSGADPKNLAFLYDQGRRPVLAPFYDLVCTRAYRKLDRHLGMGIAGERDPMRIGRDHWLGLAREIAVKEKTILGVVVRTLDEAEPALSRADERFRAAHGDHPILRVVPVMRSQIAWVRDKLG